MLRLYLLRHAKSSWALPGQRDIERPLDERGRGDLPKIGAMMAARGFVPGHVYCSPAMRTRQTLAGILPALQPPPQVSFEPTLYQGDASAYFQCVARHPKAEALLIVGHNPSCEELASYLTGGNDKGAARFEDKYPTGALCAFEFAAPQWSMARPGEARLVEFAAPASL